MILGGEWRAEWHCRCRMPMMPCYYYPWRLKKLNVAQQAQRVTRFETDSSVGNFVRHFLPGLCVCLSHRDIGRASSSSCCSNQIYTKESIPLVQLYEKQVSGGKLLFDPLQHHAARKLTRLQLALSKYDHASFLDRLEQIEQCESDNREGNPRDGEKNPIADRKSADPSKPIPVPRGFYIYGDVGTGKSLLLNNFYNSALSLTPSKKWRVHFHFFLQEMHQRIHGINKKLLHKHGRSFHIDTSKHRNSIIRLAEQLSNQVTLLCIDEFQVTDVADAMMLSQFFGELWRRGVVVVATSNRPPQDLYENGINRGYFLPFLDLLEKYCVVHHLADQTSGKSTIRGKDYRRIRSGVDLPDGHDKFKYFYLIRAGKEDQTSQKMNELFTSFEDLHTPNACRPLILDVHFQRTINISRYHSNLIACFTFDELCTTELGSSDYHAIANYFRIVMIENVPRLTLKHPDRARRFITLIDELYEAGCCLVISAADIPDRLFVGDVSDVQTNNDSKMTDTFGIMAVDVAQAQGTVVGEMASVKELSFAFGRAASRIFEMSSTTWWDEKFMIHNGQANVPLSESRGGDGDK